MSETFIRPRNHTGGNNDDFVGMEFGSESGKPVVNAVFPLGYRFSSDSQADLKKELYELLRAIRRYSNNADGRLEGDRAYTDDFPFDAYVTVIKAFMQYGYYIEQEVRYDLSPSGKISWKRTIAKIRPTISDGNPIYTDFVVRKTEKKTENLISLIHEWCVYEAFEKFGWLFTSFKPRIPELTIGKEKKEREYFISVIRNSLKSTFNDRNKRLFAAMIAMLSHTRAEGKDAFFYGTTHFQTVWENLIDTAYGISKSEKKAYFPPADWHFIDSIPMARGNKLCPDSIMLNGGEVFVLDAKYYSFTVNYSVPSASDINKQITYGRYAYENKIKKRSKVYNAFLIPYDFEQNPHKLPIENNSHYVCIGYAALTSDDENPRGKESYDKVLGVLVDTKWLMENAGKIDKADLADFIRIERTRKDKI